MLKKFVLSLALVGVVAFATGCSDVEPGEDLDIQSPQDDMNPGDGIGG